MDAARADITVRKMSSISRVTARYKLTTMTVSLQRRHWHRRTVEWSELPSKHKDLSESWLAAAEFIVFLDKLYLGSVST